jgi:hypothetical protein
MNQYPDGPMVLPCIVCDRPINCHVYDGRPGMADDAILCDSTGNYGSTVFDADGCMIAFVVCDSCVVKKRGALVALHCSRARAQYYQAELPIPETLPENSRLNDQTSNPLPQEL